MSTQILSDKSFDVVRAKVGARTKPFSDLDLGLKPHPNFGDVIPLKDINAVKNSIRNLILTSYGERPFQPNIGCDITNKLFENFNPVTVASMREAIHRTIKYHEKRAQVTKIDIEESYDRNSIFLSIQVKILNIPDLIDIELYLERTR